eukprot:m.345741 g.345741  ORF g.345741 m.345741 type:complete len:1174 (+) comp27133_c0_seq1:188-3709(+)
MFCIFGAFLLLSTGAHNASQTPNVTHATTLLPTLSTSSHTKSSSNNPNDSYMLNCHEDQDLCPLYRFNSTDLSTECYNLLNQTCEQIYNVGSYLDSWGAKFPYTYEDQRCKEMLLCYDCSNKPPSFNKIPCPPSEYKNKTHLLALTLANNKGITNDSIAGLFGEGNPYSSLAGLSLRNTSLSTLTNWTNMEMGLIDMSYLTLSGEGLLPGAFYNTIVAGLNLSHWTLLGQGIQKYALDLKVYNTLDMSYLTVPNGSEGVQMSAMTGTVNGPLFLNNAYIEGKGIQSSAFSGLSVRSLDMTYSYISGPGLQVSIFEGLTSSENIDLSYSNISGIQEDAFNVASCDVLNLSHTIISGKGIEEYAFFAAKVGILDLTYARIVSIGDAFGQMQLYSKLDLSYAEIYGEAFKPFCFQNLKVPQIIMRHTVISGKGIQNQAFAFAETQTLDMSGAIIRHGGIRSNAFFGLKVFSELYLPYNFDDGLILNDMQIYDDGIQTDAFAGLYIDADFRMSNGIVERIEENAFSNTVVKGNLIMTNMTFIGDVGLAPGALNGLIVVGTANFNHSKFVQDTLYPKQFHGFRAASLNLYACGLKHLAQIQVSTDFGFGPFYGIGLSTLNPEQNVSDADYAVKVGSQLPTVYLQSNSISEILEYSLSGLNGYRIDLKFNDVSVYKAFWAEDLSAAEVDTAGNPSFCSISADNNGSDTYTNQIRKQVSCKCTRGTSGTGSYCDKMGCDHSLQVLNSDFPHGTYVPSSCEIISDIVVPSSNISNGDCVIARCEKGYHAVDNGAGPTPIKCLGGGFMPQTTVCVPNEIGRLSTTQKAMIGVSIALNLIFAGVLFLVYSLRRTRRKVAIYKNENLIVKRENTLHERLLQEKDEELMMIRKTWEIDWRELDIDYPVGSGAFGNVYAARWLGNKVAVKSLHLARADEWSLQDFEREAEVMSVLRCPNIVLFFGAGKDDRDVPFIVTEFMHGGSLRSLLEDRQRELSWDRRLQISCDIATGMKFLHGRSPPMLHRDLKSDNVLLTETGTAKVADFGSIKAIDRGNETRFGSKSSQRGALTVTATLGVGTPLWSAPEIYAGKWGVSHYGAAADVYSFSIVMYEIATRKLPFEEVSMEIGALNKHISKGGRPRISEEEISDIPPRYMQLMQDCWQQNAQNRPSFAVVFQSLNEINQH